MSIQSDSPRGSRQPSFKMSSAQLGMYVFLVTLAVIFVANIVAYLITRANNREWRTAGLPELPMGLWLSTLFIILISVSGHGALRALKANRFSLFKTWMRAMLGLAVAFLVAQGANWHSMTMIGSTATLRNLYSFTFFMLTGLHALHVLGGFVPIGIVLSKAQKNRYSSSRFEGVSLCVQYWDFLGVVWLVLLATLYAVT
ncbi:MAG: cytochrome c oxidase subunit 3 [Polyangiaceae bacterium]|nr:cytochrome c oxidase subunit 3 [Polyangiaceae bacterium]